MNKSSTLVFSKEAQAQKLQAEIEKQKQAAENTIRTMVSGMDIVYLHSLYPILCCEEPCYPGEVSGIKGRKYNS